MRGERHRHGRAKNTRRRTKTRTQHPIARHPTQHISRSAQPSEAHSRHIAVISRIPHNIYAYISTQNCVVLAARRTAVSCCCLVVKTNKAAVAKDERVGQYSSDRSLSTGPPNTTTTQHPTQHRLSAGQQNNSTSLSTQHTRPTQVSAPHQRVDGWDGCGPTRGTPQQPAAPAKALVLRVVYQYHIMR